MTGHIFSGAIELWVAAIGFWWIGFGAVEVHDHETYSAEIRVRVTQLVPSNPIRLRASIGEVVQRWCERLGDVGLEFSLKPNPAKRLLILKWLIGGLLCTGLALIGAAVFIYSATLASEGKP